MDGTSKMAPTVLHKLYTTHLPIGLENSIILYLLSYILITRERKVLYKYLFGNLADAAEGNGLQLNPQAKKD